MSVSKAFLGFFKKAKFILEPPLEFDPACKIDQSLLENCKPHHRRAVELAMADLYGKRHEALLRLPAAWERALSEHVLNDARDLRLALTLLQVTLWFVFSCTVQLAVLPNDRRALWWMVVHLPVTWVVLGQRFILAMHYAAHRPLFSPRRLGAYAAAALNTFPQTVLSNFYGMPCGTYYVHHCIMHHQANNFFPYDISSTMPYQRDNVFHFLAYVINFGIHTLLYLPWYAIQKRRLDVCAGVALCVSVYLGAFLLLYGAAPYFFIQTFAVPFVLGPFALMLGNYSQHIFVDPENPTSNYGLACNHLRAPFNMLTFNDGYHITHHVSSITHWSEMPLHFIRHIDQYEAGGAILFEGIPFDDVTFNVFAGEAGLRRLAKRVVQITPTPLTDDELVAKFRKRLQPIKSETAKLKAPQISVFLVNELLWTGLAALGFPCAIMPAVMVPIFHAIYFLA